MRPALPDELVDFARGVDRAMRAAGGADLARAAATDEAIRTRTLPELLTRLDSDDLDPRADLENLLAAAQLARAAGAYALPYPVAAVLAASGLPDVDFLVSVDEENPRVEHADLPGRWLGIDGRGAAWSIGPVHRGPLPYPSTRYVHPVQLTGSPLPSHGRDLALALLLDAWRMLGAAESAHAMAVSHVQVREQFGRPLARFQGVQFHVSDSEVSLRGLRQLAQFTAWRWFSAPDDVEVDALALRVQAIETLELVLRLSHLLHGAVGFCDEHDLAVLDMAITPALRVPWGLEDTTERLADAIGRCGFAGPFSDPAVPTVERRRAGAHGPSSPSQSSPA